MRRILRVLHSNKNIACLIYVLFYFLVQKAAEIVQKAKNPVCLLGSQSTLPPTSTSDVVDALEVILLLQIISISFFLYV